MNNLLNADCPRRHFLRGVGIALAIPTFESLVSPRLHANQKTSAKAKRFVCVAPDYGVHTPSFFPKQTGQDYPMSHLLKSMERHRNNFSVFSHLDHPNVGGGHACSATFLNGIKSSDVRGNRRKLFSLDQYIAEQIGSDTRFPGLIAGKGAPVSYTRAGIPVPSVAKPDQFFNQLFVEDKQQAKIRKRRALKDNQSILDLLMEDTQTLQNKLAAQDRDKLDEYLTAIRETEQKLKRRQNWVDIAKPQVKKPKVDENAEYTEYPYDMGLYFETMALALQTDSTRVIVYQLPGGNRRFTFDGITMGYHTLSHHGKDPKRIKQLEIIDSYYLTQLANFIDRLKKLKDTQGQPLLDSTLVLFGSGMGNASSHSSRNLPVMLAGGGLQHGKYHAFSSHQGSRVPLCNLFVTILQALGISSDKFASSNGNLNHLLT